MKESITLLPIPLNSYQSLPPTLQAAVRSACTYSTVADIVAARSEPKLASLTKSAGQRATNGLVKLLLIGLRENMHIDNGLTERDINTIAADFVNKPELSYWLTLADVDLLCRRIASGDYGNFYGHFSAIEFHKCLLAYTNERNEQHALEGEKTTATPTPPIPLSQIGYTVDKDGRITASQASLDRKLPPPLYLYDNHGRRVGENPEAWRKVRHRRTAIADGRDTIADGDHYDKMRTLVKQLMDEDSSLSYVQALEKAASIITNTNEKPNE